MFAHGCYQMSFVKRAGVWRIAALTLARAWMEGNSDLPGIGVRALAVEMAVVFVVSRRVDDML
jgi:hypothetical protein